MMRTRKNDLVSDDVKEIIGNIIKEERIKHNYSLEDLSKALSGAKNRQTLHKYETGSLNIPYDILFQICQIFNITNLLEIVGEANEKEMLEKKIIRQYVNNTRKDKSLTIQDEKILNTYKNAIFEPMVGKNKLSIRIMDDSMEGIYYKGDKVYFERQKDYKNGDDIVIAIKGSVLSVRRLYRYSKGIILQAINPKYQTINVNIIGSDMILGKVKSIYREVK